MGIVASTTPVIYYGHVEEGANVQVTSKEMRLEMGELITMAQGDANGHDGAPNSKDTLMGSLGHFHKVTDDDSPLYPWECPTMQTK